MKERDSSEPSYDPHRALDKATLTERVYQSLRDDIVSNRLPPDTPLQEASIASALEVSRGPVREAMRRLEAEGLINLIPRRGAVVRSLSQEEFLDAYRVREALEVLAIRLATHRIEADHLDQLNGLHQQMVQYAAREEVDAFFDANTRFHALFVEQSGNPKLQEVYFPLVNQMLRYRMRSLSLRGGMQRSCEEHQAILEAVREKDTEQAAHLLSEHIRVPLLILESDSELVLASPNPAPDAATTQTILQEQE
jgi:DNA-binding GntR family transcriptional regulator